MKKFYKKNKKLAGVFFLLLAVAFFVFWEFIGRSQLLYDNVLVLRENVCKGTIITEDMLELIKIDTGSHIADAVIQKSDIQGLEAKHYIPAKTQLVKDYFDLPELVLDDNEKIMKLPDSWVHSYPETLRRKDKVYLYAIKKDDNTNEVQVLNADSDTVEGNEDEGLYIFNTTVAYVKDNTNREVESLDTDRLAGSSTINIIEVVITDKEFKMLRDYANGGYTFALLYK